MLENVLDKAQLEYSDILLLKPEKVAKKLEKGGVDKAEISTVQCNLAKEALASEIPLFGSLGLKESTSNVIKILATARLAKYCKDLKPTILCISNISKISRNKVSPMVDMLQLSDLVDTKSQRRELLILPTITADVYIDVISGNLEEEHDFLRRTMNNIKNERTTQEDFEFLENLEAAFRLSKSAYEANTLNHEIMDEMHEKSMKLLVNTKDGKADIREFEAFSNAISQIIKTNKKAKDMGLRPVILEKTSEELGRAKVYRVK